MGDMYISGRYPTEPLKLFISYSPDDEAMKDHLLKHLSPLFHCGRASPEIWSHSSVPAGREWHTETERAINQADLALLLISASYLAEPFIMDTELPTLLNRRAEGGLVVIPVILRTCYWTAHPALKSFQPIPRDGKSIAGRDGDARDGQYTEVAMAIAKEFQRRQGRPTKPDSSSDLLPPSPGRIRLVQEARFTYPSSGLRQSRMHDILTEALRMFPLVLEIAPVYMKRYPSPAAPWKGPTDNNDGGLTLSFEHPQRQKNLPYKIECLKDGLLRLYEYVDDDTYPSAYLDIRWTARRIAAFTIFSIRMGRLLPGLIRLNWQLLDAEGVTCRVNDWASVDLFPTPGVFRAGAGLVRAPVSGPAHTAEYNGQIYYDGLNDIAAIVSHAIRDLFYRFSYEGQGGTSQTGLVQPTLEQISVALERLYNED